MLSTISFGAKEQSDPSILGYGGLDFSRRSRMAIFLYQRLRSRGNRSALFAERSVAMATESDPGANTCWPQILQQNTGINILFISKVSSVRLSTRSIAITI